MLTLQKRELKSRIRNGEPIPVCDVLCYPITMSYYDEYLACKDALALRQSSLPARFLQYDFLTAIFNYEIENAKSEDKKNIGLFYRVIRLLFLSLRLDFNDETLQNCLYYAKVGEEYTLSHILVEQDGKQTNISTRDFSILIRPIIAEQNGIELPDESETLEIVQAYDELKSAGSENAVKLDMNTETLISSVAYASHLRENDLYSWTVREFENRRKAIERDKRYMLYGQAELSGAVTFKKGNPYPSWCLDSKDDSYGTKPLSELSAQLPGAT